MGKNRFLTGMISGIACCLLIFGIAGCVLDEDKGPKLKEDQMIDQSDLASEMKDTDYATKINLLTAMIDRYYIDEADKDVLIEGLYAGLVNSLGDVYSTYYTAEEFESFTESSTGTYAGLGASVTSDQNGNVIIVKPFVGGPAYEAGILPGDILVSIDGTDVIGMDLTAAVAMIKGEPGSRVTLEIYRSGEPEYLTLELTRAIVEVPTVEYQMLEDQIGYIYVMEFDEVTAAQFIEAVDTLQEQGMQGLIIDLRDNPGGMLTTVCSMLDRLLPKDSLLIYTEDKYGKRDSYYAQDDETISLPLVVMINGNSASASEVFAGAVQDYEIGTLLGTQSFGKGIVQSIIPLNDGSALKLTVSKYYTPSGRNIHGTGLTPDIVVALDEALWQQASIPLEDDNQVQAAISHLQKEIGR